MLKCTSRAILTLRLARSGSWRPGQLNGSAAELDMHRRSDVSQASAYFLKSVSCQTATSLSKPRWPRILARNVFKWRSLWPCPKLRGPCRNTKFVPDISHQIVPMHNSLYATVRSDLLNDRPIPATSDHPFRDSRISACC